MGKKLAVIGAGPGGLFAAKEAATLGLSVTVFEKGKIGENIACAEGFVDLLKLLPQPVAGICFPVDRLLITVKDQFDVDCTRLNLWMLDRRIWQQALAREAMARGCEVLEQHPITPDRLHELKKEYDWVIDASGARAVSAAAFRLSNLRKAVAAQYTLEGDFSNLAGKLKIVVLDAPCSGYGWVFPKSGTQANVGLGWFGKKKEALRIKGELETFLRKEGLDRYRVVRRSAGLIPIRPREKTVVDNVILIGDAAGFGSPLHGGGIDTACISGILAAKAAFADDPNWYEQSVHKLIGLRLKLEQKVLDLWEASDFEALNRYAASALAEDGTQSSWRKMLVPEAVVLRSILSGLIRGDWEKGIILDDLPVVAKVVLKAALAGRSKLMKSFEHGGIMNNRAPHDTNSLDRRSRKKRT